MTFKTFKQKLHQLGFTVECLEPDEVDVISLDPKQIVDKTSRFPKEFTGVYMSHAHQMFIGHQISDKLFLLVKHFADTPVNERHIPAGFEDV